MPTAAPPTARKPEMLFVFPHYDEMGSGCIDSFTYSLGTGYIRAYLAKHDIYSRQYIQYEPGTIGQAAVEIIESGADIVGFSCIDYSLYGCVIIAEAVKKIRPDIKIIFGGPAVTLADELIMKRNQCVDICCRGESEETACELLLTLRKGGDIADVRGITFRRGDRIVRTPDRMPSYRGKKQEALDFLPSPYLMNMMTSGPRHSKRLHRESQVTLLTARGCTHKCTYCTNTVLTGNRIRYHSLDRVIAELKYTAEFIRPSQTVMLVDDAFTLNVARAKQICRRIIEESLNYLAFECITRIDKFDRELLELLVQAGFKSIAFGLESASPRVLNIIKKVRSKPAVNGDYAPEQRFLETMKRNIESANSLGLATIVSIIVGLPGETPEDARETLKFVRELKVKYYTHNYLDIIYGTELFTTCRSYGLELKPSPFQLPYRREFAYDVFDLKPLDYSINHQLLKERNEKAVEIFLSFFGVGRQQGEAADETGAAVPRIFITAPPPSRELGLFAWLSTITPFTGDIFITENRLHFNTYEDRLKLFAETQMPVYQYHMVKKEEKESIPHDGGGRVVTYRLQNFLKTYLATERYSYGGGPDFKYHVLPFSCDWPEPVDVNTEIRLKTIDSMGDIYNLLKLCKGNAGELKLTPGEAAGFDYEILDKCRWSCQTCPADALDRLLVNENNDVLTCYSGFPAGKVGAAPGELRKKLEGSRKEAEERRGCGDCPVREICARCIFLPSFLSESQYCDIMRGFKSLRFAVEIPSLIGQLQRLKKDELAGAGSLRISWLANPLMGDKNRFPCYFLKIGMGDTHYLYHTGKRLFSGLSPTMNEIWELLAAGHRDREEICSQVAEKRGVSCNAVSNTFDILDRKMDNLLNQGAKPIIGG